jgi:Fe-S cluster assembly protein SufB
MGKGAARASSYVSCDTIIMGNKARAETIPFMDIFSPGGRVEHEAKAGKIRDEELSYLMSRGIGKDEAEGMIVNGFIEPIVRELPLEYAVELNRLIGLSMENSVG